MYNDCFILVRQFCKNGNIWKRHIYDVFGCLPSKISSYIGSSSTFFKPQGFSSVPVMVDPAWKVKYACLTLSGGKEKDANMYKKVFYVKTATSQSTPLSRQPPLKIDILSNSPF